MCNHVKLIVFDLGNYSWEIVNPCVRIFVLIVDYYFFTDLTLWPLHVDECVSPFLKEKLVHWSSSIILLKFTHQYFEIFPCYSSLVSDSVGRVCSLYPNVQDILNFLQSRNYTLAVASRAKNICGSYQLLHFLDIAKYFRYKEIYPGSKRQHFRKYVCLYTFDSPI